MEKRDLRARLSVRVTATAGASRVDATSLQTDRIAKATTTVKVRVLGRAGRSVRLRIALSAVGVKTRGTVVVRVDGRRVARVDLARHDHPPGAVGRGARHQVAVTYLGSKQAARATTTVVVRR